jgi:hypothetical protein
MTPWRPGLRVEGMFHWTNVEPSLRTVIAALSNTARGLWHWVSVTPKIHIDFAETPKWVTVALLTQVAKLGCSMKSGIISWFNPTISDHKDWQNGFFFRDNLITDNKVYSLMAIWCPPLKFWPLLVWPLYRGLGNSKTFRSLSHSLPVLYRRRGSDDGN